MNKVIQSTCTACKSITAATAYIFSHITNDYYLCLRVTGESTGIKVSWERNCVIFIPESSISLILEHRSCLILKVVYI